MTMLEDLWYGNVNPHEAILTENRRYKHLLSLMGSNRDELSKMLTDKQMETLEKYDEALNEMHSLAEVEAFSYGFRLGVRLMIEAGIPLTKGTT
jgi:hypothetical protein